MPYLDKKSAIDINQKLTKKIQNQGWQPHFNSSTQDSDRELVGIYYAHKSSVKFMDLSIEISKLYKDGGVHIITGDRVFDSLSHIKDKEKHLIKLIKENISTGMFFSSDKFKK